MDTQTHGTLMIRDSTHRAEQDGHSTDVGGSGYAKTQIHTAASPPRPSLARCAEHRYGLVIMPAARSIAAFHLLHIRSARSEDCGLARPLRLLHDRSQSRSTGPTVLVVLSRPQPYPSASIDVERGLSVVGRETRWGSNAKPAARCPPRSCFMR